MRLKTMARATPVLVFALLATACDNGFTGLNENPNAPASVTPQYLFPNGITNVVGTIRGGGFDLTFTSLWAQQIAMDRFTDEDRYSMRPGNIDGWWSGFYSGGLEDFATILQQTTPDSEPDLVAPALIMKSWTFGVMTDIWGDIPYSEANQGKGGFTPKYDSQKDIYTGLFTDLTTANDLLTSGGAGDNYGSADVIYNGDMGKWQRFANSLRLRFAMRLQRVDAATAQNAVMTLGAKVYGANDPRTAVAIQNYAEIHSALKRYAESEALHRKALAIFMKAYGEQNFNTAVSLHNIGAMLYAQDKNQEAEKFLRRALAVKQKVLKPDNLSIAPTLDQLAAVLDSLGRQNEAERYRRRAAGIKQRAQAAKPPA